jgi:hypothetical protein
VGCGMGAPPSLCVPPLTLRLHHVQALQPLAGLHAGRGAPTSGGRPCRARPTRGAAAAAAAAVAARRGPAARCGGAHAGREAPTACMRAPTRRAGLAARTARTRRVGWRSAARGPPMGGTDARPRAGRPSIGADRGGPGPALHAARPFALAKLLFAGGGPYSSLLGPVVCSARATEWWEGYCSEGCFPICSNPSNAPRFRSRFANRRAQTPYASRRGTARDGNDVPAAAVRRPVAVPEHAGHQRVRGDAAALRRVRRRPLIGLKGPASDVEETHDGAPAWRGPLWGHIMRTTWEPVPHDVTCMAPMAAATHSEATDLEVMRELDALRRSTCAKQSSIRDRVDGPALARWADGGRTVGGRWADGGWTVGGRCNG